MEFLLTTYIYPLETQLVLSDSLGFCLDNPKTDLEVDVLKDYLQRAYESGYDLTIPRKSDESILTVENALLRFRDALRDSDPYVDRVFDAFDSENIFEFVARIWVIARFDDEGVGQQLRDEHNKMRDKGEAGFFMLEDDHILVRKPKQLASYCHILALLSHTERDSFFGHSILLESEPVDHLRPTSRIWQRFMMNTIASHDYPNSKDEARWWFFPYAQAEIRRASEALEGAITDGSLEKLLYIGDVLKIAGEDTRDTKIRLVLLTSILELLLTHNPDFSRYNVEDSISKQFQLKGSLLIYLNDRNRSLNEIKARLKTIYRQRSNVAHGNFGAVDKYMSSLSRKEGKEEYFDDLVVDLYSYIRAVLEQYLADRDLVDFVKDN